VVSSHPDARGNATRQHVLQAHAASTGDAAHPLLAGIISLAGPRLRETLDWLQIDVDQRAAGRLNQFALQATLAANGPNLQLTTPPSARRFKGTGSATMTVSAQTAAISNVALQVGLDTFDVHRLPAPTVAGACYSAGRTTTITTGRQQRRPRCRRQHPLQRRSRHPQRRAQGQDRQTDLSQADAERRGPDLALAGSNAQAERYENRRPGWAQGGVSRIGDRLTNAPRFDLVASVSTPAPTRSALIGAPSPFKGKLGALTASGGIIGTASRSA